MLVFDIIINLGNEIKQFSFQGGVVINALLLLSLLLWTLMIERFLYLFFAHNKVQDAALRLWQQRADKCSWWALKIRECLLSEQQAKLFARLTTIKMLIALCPLLGLLGTVTGMISVFDTIAITGSSGTHGRCCAR